MSLILVFFTACSSGGERVETHREKFWEKFVFKEIEQRLKCAELPQLRNSTNGKDSYEIRVWVGSGITTLRGVILKSDGSSWQGIYLPTRLSKASLDKECVTRLASPRSGWQRLKKTIKELRIETTPDWNMLEAEPVMLDGELIVVEFRDEYRYRTFVKMRFGPEGTLESERVRDVELFVKFVEAEFGIRLLSEAPKDSVP